MLFCQSEAMDPKTDLDEDACWQMMVSRDPAPEPAFICGVLSTGIYCRPGCPARMPLRKNVRFFRTTQAAKATGLRPCLRCIPDVPYLSDAALVEQACRMLEAPGDQKTLAGIAEALSVSRSRLHNIFKQQLGITAKAYGRVCRDDTFRAALQSGMSVTDAIYEAGFGASSRFYEQQDKRFGMTPRILKKGGLNMVIRYTINQSWLGRTLIGATDKGICLICMGPKDDLLVEDMQKRFPKALFEKAEAQSPYQTWISQVMAAIETPGQPSNLPLDIQGTAFQAQVWEALMAIPAGETRAYSELAASIGRPTATRAVAAACGANKLAVIIPCHRVVGKNGALTGYRWGKDLKQKLLDEEREI